MDAKRNGVRADWNPPRSRKFTTGWSTIASSGNRVLTASTTICKRSRKRNSPRRRSMSASNAINNSAIHTSENGLTIKRIFDAPRDLVFAAWTEQQHLDRWQNAPQEFTVTVEKSDIRTGGSFRIC